MARRITGLSRDMRVQIGIAVVAVVLYGVSIYTGVVDDDRSAAVVLLALYALLFGGSHLYLALRGADGLVPVGARWRWVATLVVVLACVSVFLLEIDRTLGPVAIDTLALWVLLATIAVYVVVEGVSGYRETQSE
ncbi:hypothetical protein [Halovivax gelatinilyticus]|uniref:hypothetical protein n=1 Tax=Halovivax gelatinilyticus TaxID=2961597 RepID=UPI0020CA4F66|nr:hypothetical protein [Halovivax gelatinilyticus]